MAAVWYRFRVEFCTRWRSIAALALLVGVAGGATIAAIAIAIAGTRRTQTAHSRLVQATNAWDVLVNPDQGSSSALDSDAVASLPIIAWFPARRAARTRPAIVLRSE